MEKIGDEDYSVKVIGGQNITDKRPLFSYDSQLIIVPSVRTVRVYLVSTGQLLRSLRFNEFNETEVLVNIQTHPVTELKQIVCFTNEGRVVFIDYLTGETVKEYFIVRKIDHSPLNAMLNYPGEMRITFGYVFNYSKSKEQNTDLIVAYLLSDGNHCCLYFANLGSKTAFKVFSLIASATLGELGIAFGNNNEYVVTVENDNLRVLELNFEETKTNHHKIGEQSFTCVSCHPNRRMIAAGDTIGRIFIYVDDFMENSRPKRSVVHWHSLAVKDLTFSCSGSYIYSVGFEAVAIRWSVADVGEKNVLPRLGYPLKYAVCDRNDENLAISRFDNSIIIVGSHFSDPKQTIEGLTYGFGQCVTIPSTGLVWDSRSECFALNGRTGHLQWYSPYTEKQLCQVDIVCKNLICPRIGDVIFNIEVTKAAISSNGEWLATIEMRDDRETLPEIRLKFWKATNGPEMYELNTTIHLPHRSHVSELQFSHDSKFLVSTSVDKEFKIWHLLTSSDSKNESMSWTCGRVGSLNSATTPYCIAVSFDSSVLAVSFDSFITLWDISDVDKLVYRCHLMVTDSSCPDIVEKLIFGCGNKANLLVEFKTSILRVWDLLTLSVLWSWSPDPRITIDCIALDSYTNNIAVFLSNACLNVFNIDSKSPLKSINISKEIRKPYHVFSASFIPRKTASDNKLFNRSYLCFMVSNQELIVVLPKEEYSISNETSQRALIENFDNVTPFAAMLIKRKNKELTTGDSAELKDLHKFFDTEIDSSKLVENMFLKVPSHVLPPVEQICSTFLKSLLRMELNDETEEEAKIEVESIADNNAEEIEMEEESEKERDPDFEIEEEIIVTSMSKARKGKDFVFSEDYSWLAQ